MLEAKKSSRLVAWSLVAATVTAGLVARNYHPFSKPDTTALSSRLKPIFEKTKTVCFGQFVVEVPATATVVYGPASVNDRIAYFPGEAHKLDEHVAMQLTELEKHRIYFSEDDLLKLPMLGKVIEGGRVGQKLLFGSPSQIGYAVYSYIPIGEDLFVQDTKNVTDEDVDNTVASLNKVAAFLRSRRDDDVPAESGTCIDGGFVSLLSKFEQTTVGIRLKEFPDVHLSIDVLKNDRYLPEYSDLETRLKDAERGGGHWYSRIAFFRRGPRKIGAWKGAEALALKPAQEGVKASHEFHFISLGAPNASLQPRLDVQLDTGASGHKMGAVKPSLSDEEAVALWDKLIGTIRIRPVDTSW